MMRKVGVVAEERAGRHVRVAWTGTEEIPIVFANQFLGQVGGNGEILFTVGQASPPVILAETDAERDNLLEQLSSVPVKPLARYVFDRTTLEQLIQILQQTRDIHDQVRQQRQAGADQATEEGENGGT
jgi:hypothetical protein